VAPVFEPSDLDFPILANGEEAVRDGNTLVLLRWKEDNVAVDGLDCQGKVGPFLNISGELLEIGMCRAFSPHIEGVNERVDQFKSPAFRKFPVSSRPGLRLHASKSPH